MRRLAAYIVDGLVASITALLALIPAAHRPGFLANRVKQITTVMRTGGGINELYAQLYSSMLGKLPLINVAREKPVRWQAAQHRDIIADPIERMGYFALLGTLVDGTLAKVDRASMAYSLEVRVQCWITGSSNMPGVCPRRSNVLTERAASPCCVASFTATCRPTW